MIGDGDGQRPIIIQHGPKKNSFESCLSCVGTLACILIAAVLFLYWLGGNKSEPSDENTSIPTAASDASPVADSAVPEIHKPEVRLTLPADQTVPVVNFNDWPEVIPADAYPTGVDDCDRPVLVHSTQSLDGGYVYQQVCRWATSDDIIQVRLSDGRRREVSAGNSLSVIRNGKWRGFLLIAKHKYRDGPEGGSYDATWVVKPNGQEMLMVPGTEDGDSGQVKAWLEDNGWAAD